MSEEDINKNMKQCCSEVIYIKKRWEQKNSPRFYFSLFQNLFSCYPYVISKYYSDSMKNLVNLKLSQGSYDVIICDFLFSSIFLPEQYYAKSILFQHNTESIIWERHYRNQLNPIKKSYLYLQWRKLFNYEKRTCPRFKACIVVSLEDKKRLKDFGVKHQSVISTGVDTKYFSPLNTQEKPYNLVFTGSMDWLPNEDGIIYFVKSVYPRIKKVIPQVTLTIVGRQPTTKVMSLGQMDSSIEVTGTVSDVRPYIDRAAVYIVPIRIGGGTRLKIYEAMSMSKAVVSTSVGAEGLQLENDQNIIIADHADFFAECTVELLKNSNKRHKIGAAARELMIKIFDWFAVTKEFENFCQGLSNKK